MKKLLFLLLMFAVNLWAKENFNELSLGVGYNSVSFNERESSIEFDDEGLKRPAESGKISLISLNASYSVFNAGRKRIFIEGAFPVINSGDENYYYGGILFKYFFQDLNAPKNFNFPDGSLFVMPKLRYYLGIGAGIGYMVYTITNAKKDDTSFELKALGGISYMINNRYGVDFNASYGRGSGSLTSTNALKASLSLVLFL